MQNQSRLPLRRIEISVSRTHGEAVRLADDRAADDLHREIKIANQATDDRQLSGIFLSEESGIWFEDMKQLGHNCCDATKVSGAGSSAQSIAHPFDIDIGHSTAGIHFFCSRRKQ